MHFIQSLSGDNQDNSLLKGDHSDESWSIEKVIQGISSLCALEKHHVRMMLFDIPVPPFVDGLHQKNCPRYYRHLCAAPSCLSEQKPSEAQAPVSERVQGENEFVSKPPFLIISGGPWITETSSRATSQDDVPFETRESSSVWLRLAKRRHSNCPTYSLN